MATFAHAPERNAELLRAVGDRVAAHPDLYDQAEWAQPDDCGTRGCVAGHAVELADGYTFQTRYFHGSITNDPTGAQIPTAIAAREVLGLTEGEATILFAGGWKPAGWDHDLGHADTAALVRDALYALADGATIFAVSQKPLIHD